MASTTQTAKGTNPNAVVPFLGNVRKDHPMAIPSGCMCTWIVRANHIWVMKYESYLCPYRGRH
jgi:hypothetical protein